MARTTFVNPFRGRKSRRKRKGARGSRRRHKRTYARARNPRRRAHRRSRRRNAGITPFIQNPLILSNPRRRHRRRNPGLGMPSLNKMFSALLTGGGGAATALTLNTVALNKIPNPWLRRGSQALAAIFGGALIASKSPAMGQAYAGAQLYPLVQDLAADLLGVGAGAAAATEADIDALAADLEDVMDEMDEDSDFGDDDDEEMYAP